MQKTDSNVLQTKQHFDLLDGLRGVAALAVVMFHFMEMVYTDYSKNFIAHGFLAVDFFFCLSGFVIAYAYDNRIVQMGKAQFFWARIIRLQPLVIAGSVLGLLAFLFDPFGGHPELYSAGKILLLFACSIFMIPYGVMPDRFFNLFGLNAPAWSLFWEYVANILYAFVLYKIARRWLLVITVIGAVLLCMVAYKQQMLMGGWGKDNFWDGGARISYSFSAGMLVYRSGWIIKSNIGFAALALLLAVSFVVPFTTWNWLTEPLIVIFYFPLLVALGAGGRLTPGMRKICVFSGKISYPLYMTHYAGIWMFANYYSSYKPSMRSLFFIIPGGMIVLVLLVWVVMVAYDIPVRKWLTQKRKRML